MIVYERGGAEISHYILPRERQGASRPPAVAEYRTGPGGSSMPVVTWATPSLEQALVGELAPDELLRIAAAGA